LKCLVGFVTRLLGQVAGISDLRTIADTDLFLATIVLGDGQEFWRLPSLRQVHALVPTVEIIREINDQDGVLAMHACRIVRVLRFTLLVLAGKPDTGDAPVAGAAFGWLSVSSNSGRALAIAVRTIAVMSPSPMPISMCVPAIVGKATDHATVPDAASSPAQAIEAMTVLAQAATTDAKICPKSPFTMRPSR